jgi:hypothetical protein
MEQTSTFQILFNAALQDYQNQTGNSLIDHPLVKQLESCDSVDSITAILQEKAQIFCNFRGDDGKLMKSMKYSVNFLYTLSVSTASIGLVRPIHSFILLVRIAILLQSPPVNAIFAGIAILLAVCPLSESICIYP